jgi:hypothetical protein
MQPIEAETRDTCTLKKPADVQITARIGRPGPGKKIAERHARTRITPGDDDARR